MVVVLCVGGGICFISKCVVERMRRIMIAPPPHPLGGGRVGAGVLRVR